MMLTTMTEAGHCRFNAPHHAQRHDDGQVPPHTTGNMAATKLRKAAREQQECQRQSEQFGGVSFRRAEPTHIGVDRTLTRPTETDLRIRVSNLNLQRVGRVAQSLHQTVALPRGRRDADDENCAAVLSDEQRIAAVQIRKNTLHIGHGQQLVVDSASADHGLRPCAAPVPRRCGATQFLQTET